MGAADTMMLATSTVPGVPWFHAHPGRACANIPPDDMFKDDRKGIRAAVAVCQPCTFKYECGEWAYTTEQVWGVWGATTPTQRRTVFRARRKAARQGVNA